MKTIIKKPHIFFFSLIPLFLILGFAKTGGTIDVTIHNTFFAVKTHYWCYFSAVFIGLIGLNYYMLYWANKPTIQILSLFHILFQVAALIPFVFCVIFLNTKIATSSSFLRDSVDFYSLLSTSYLIFIISIGIHLLNFILTILIKNRE